MGTLEELLNNFSQLAQWFAVFERTDAREVIGFDLAMEICGCYDITIRKLARLLQSLFSECKYAKSLNDIRQADKVVAFCTRMCADNIAHAVDLHSVISSGDYSDCANLDNLLSIRDRLRPLASRDLPEIGGTAEDRVSALVELIGELTTVIKTTRDKLVKETEKCTMLQCEKSNLDSTLSAKEEEYNCHVEASRDINMKRIEDLTTHIEEQKSIIEKLAVTQAKERASWEDIRRKLVKEIEKAKRDIKDAEAQRVTVVQEKDSFISELRTATDILSRESERATADAKDLQEKYESQMGSLLAEKESLKNDLARLKEVNSELSHELANKERCVSELESRMTYMQEDIENIHHNLREMVRLKSSVDVLCRALDLDLRNIEPTEISHMVNDKTVASVAYLQEVLRRTCVIRVGAQAPDYTEPPGDTVRLFAMYESMLMEAIRSLGTEQSPMDMNDVTRSRRFLKVKRKTCVEISHGKQRKCETVKMRHGKSEPKSTAACKFERSPEMKWSKSEARSFGETKSHSFTITDKVTVDQSYTNVTSYVTNEVLRWPSEVIVLVNLGSESPLSTLLRIVRPDYEDKHDHFNQDSCHCLGFAQLAHSLKCTFLVCWTPGSMSELYGLEYNDREVYMIIVEKIGDVRRYYMMAVKTEDHVYVSDLARLDSPVILPKDVFTHNDTMCSGPMNQTTVTHCPSKNVHLLVTENQCIIGGIFSSIHEFYNYFENKHTPRDCTVKMLLRLQQM